MAAIDDNGVIIATAYHVLAIGREVYTVYAIGVLSKHFRYSKRAKHLVCQLHWLRSTLLGAETTCGAWGHLKISMGGARLRCGNIYGIWAGGGEVSFENFKMAEGEEAISTIYWEEPRHLCEFSWLKFLFILSCLY